MSQSKRLFSQKDNEFHIVTFNEETTKENLKPAVYEVCYNSTLKYFFLTLKSERFNIPKKIYGQEFKRKVDKIVLSYKERVKNTGILLTGYKGSGKTLLSELLGNKMIEEFNLPVILVNSNEGDVISFLDEIGDGVFIFDEFGKKFPTSNRRAYPTDRDSNAENRQDDFLTFLDGVKTKKRLVIFTENEIYNIDDFLLGRPGRILYHFNYKKIPLEVVTDFCNLNNLQKDAVDSVKKIYEKIYDFSFDMLKAIVEETKRFGITVEEAIEDLNIIVPRLGNKLKIKKIIEIETGDEYLISEQKNNKRLTAFFELSEDNVFFELSVKKVSSFENQKDDEENDLIFLEFAFPESIVFSSQGKVVYIDTRQRFELTATVIESNHRFKYNFNSF